MILIEFLNFDVSCNEHKWNLRRIFIMYLRFEEKQFKLLELYSIRIYSVWRLKQVENFEYFGAWIQSSKKNMKIWIEPESEAYQTEWNKYGSQISKTMWK